MAAVIMPRLIPDRESLTVEFKSDRDRLPDRDLVAAVICLANTEGGEVYVGVEEDGTVTGLPQRLEIGGGHPARRRGGCRHIADDH